MTSVLRRLKSLSAAVTVAAVLGQGALALAQDDPDGSGGGAADPSLAPSATSAEAGGDKWQRWSQRFIDRPRTLPRDMIEAGGYLDIDRQVVANATGTGTETDSSLRFSLGGGYGISDQLEVRASYGLTLSDFEAKGPLALGAAFGLAEGTLAVAAAGDFVYDLFYEIGQVALGARARYLLQPNLSLFTDRQLIIAVAGDFGGNLKPAYLRLPIGVGFQISDQLYAFGETELAVLNLKDSESQAIFADYVPLTVGGVFALSGKLEVGGLLATDLKNDAFDALLLQVFGRVYL